MIDARTTTTIFFVRHAEIDESRPLGCDTPLDAQGQLRARQLADFLDEVDFVSGPDAIYATECLRTQQTVAPLAGLGGLEVQVGDPSRVVEFAEELLSAHRREIVVVAVDDDLLPPLVEELHGKKGITDIAPNEVFIVTIPTYGRVKTLRLPYSE